MGTIVDLTRQKRQNPGGKLDPLAQARLAEHLALSGQLEEAEAMLREVLADDESEQYPISRLVEAHTVYVMDCWDTVLIAMKLLCEGENLAGCVKPA